MTNNEVEILHNKPNLRVVRLENAYSEYNGLLQS